MSIFSIKWTINQRIGKISCWKRCFSDLSTITYSLKEVMNLIKNFNIDFVFIFVKPQFGLLFDIDGVLTRGRKLLPYTRDAFRKLVTTSGQFRIPTVFVTNAGNELRSSKAAKLSQILGIPVNFFISY